MAGNGAVFPSDRDTTCRWALRTCEAPTGQRLVGLCEAESGGCFGSSALPEAGRSAVRWSVARVRSGRDLDSQVTVVFGGATSAVSDICLLVENGAVLITQPASVSGTAEFSAFAIEVPEPFDGPLFAVSRDGVLLERHWVFDAERPLRSAPKLRSAATGRLGKGSWELWYASTNGLLHTDIRYQTKRGGWSGRGVDPLLDQSDVISTCSLAGQPHGPRILVGQVAKDAAAVDATLDDGSTVAGIVVVVDQLPVHLFVVPVCGAAMIIEVIALDHRGTRRAAKRLA